MQNLRWKVITILAVLVVFGTVGVYPILAAMAARLAHEPETEFEAALGQVGLILGRGFRLARGSYALRQSDGLR